MIKVVQKYVYDEEDYKESLEIKVFENDEVVESVNFHDGENEDNCIGRNFSDVHKISSLMEYVYDAAKAGKEVIFEEEEEEEEE